MVTTGKYSIADQIKENLMHQEKDDTKQVDEARDIELDDAELENGQPEESSSTTRSNLRVSTRTKTLNPGIRIK